MTTLFVLFTAHNLSSQLNKTIFSSVGKEKRGERGEKKGGKKKEKKEEERRKKRGGRREGEWTLDIAKSK